MHAPEILLHAEGLVRCFGERRALDGLDLSLALIGPGTSCLAVHFWRRRFARA